MVLARTALLLGIASAQAAPLDVTDQSALLGGAAPPAPFDAHLASRGTSSAQLTYAIANTANRHRTTDESLLIDTESSEWRLTLQHAFTDALSVKATLPYRSYGGGNLDGFIERWHRITGTPNGIRPSVPRDDLRIEYRRDGLTRLAFGADTGSVGDAALALGYRLRHGTHDAASVWMNVELPTGSTARLNGNDAIDYSLALAYQRELGNRWLAYTQVSATYLGSTDTLIGKQQRSMWNAVLAVEYRYSNALSLVLQSDAHSSAFKATQMPALDYAVQLSLGGQYQFANDWRAQLAMTEDVNVDSAPDVMFMLRLGKAWR